jgi:hypothetical protein
VRFKHNGKDVSEYPCIECDDGNEYGKFEWRGVCTENAGAEG